MLKKIPERLLLDYIEPSRRGLSFCAVNIEDFNYWLNNLPITNTLKSYQLLLNANKELIELKIPQGLKLSLLSALSEKNRVVAEQLQKQYLHKPTVLTKKDNTICHYFESLVSIQASAYQQVFAESQRKASSLFASKIKNNIVLSATGLLHSYEMLLANQLMRYQQPKAGFWLTVHKIYHSCVLFELDTIVSPSAALKNTYSVSVGYKKLLLLAFFRTEQLPQIEIQRVHHLINTWSEFCSLSPSSSIKEQEAGINDQLDKPFIDQFTKSTANFKLSFNPIIEKLKENTVLKLGLKTHLLNCLLQNQARQFKRLSIKNNKPYEFTVGFSASHFFLRNKQPLTALLPAAHQESLSSKPSIQQAQFNYELQTEGSSHIDIWDQALSIDLPKKGTKEHNAVSQTETAYPLFNANTVNISAGGFCFEVAKDNAHLIRSGDIILLRENAQSPWQLANIRWVKSLTDKIKLGVALLSPKPTAIAALNSLLDGQKQKLQRAILIEKNPFSKQSLLLPQLNLKTGDQVQFYLNQTQQQVILKNHLLSSGLFLQFEFESDEVQVKA